MSETREERHAKQRREFVAGLRAAADFFERTPDVELPMIDHRFLIYFSTAEQLIEAAKRIGPAEKVLNDDTYFFLRKAFGPIRVEYYTNRDLVCKKVWVGTKVLPAEPSRTEVIVHEAKPERTVDEYSWKCPESIMRPKDDEMTPENDVLQSAGEAVEEASVGATPPAATEEIPF